MNRLRWAAAAARGYQVLQHAEHGGKHRSRSLASSSASPCSGERRTRLLTLPVSKP